MTELLELLSDAANADPDNDGPGRRMITGDHAYGVLAVQFLDATGAPVVLDAALNDATLKKVSADLSKVTLRNPHHNEEPDLHGTGPTDGVNDGVFSISLDQFFRNYGSVDGGVVKR